MKKLALFLALLFSISTWFSAASPLHETTEDNHTSTFVLPASLITIGDETFQGTAAENIVLSNSLTTIGERAFADNFRLITVTIPKSVIYIGEHAFVGASDMSIHGEKDSYAARWALEHNIAFVQVESAPAWLEKIGKLLAECFFVSFISGCVCPPIQLWQRRRTEEAWRSMRPQDRPELYPIDYRFP